jgi:large subunit ribosomal protein L31
MKIKIHPKYLKSTVSCVCKKVWEVQSTLSQSKISICSNCHPLFTGQKKFVDTAGRIEKFRKKYSLDENK